MTDIEIAKQAVIKPIEEIAEKAGIDKDNLELYGKYKCKIDINKFNPNGKLILVSAMNPTPLGEGKTTVSIGLLDGLRKLDKNAICALREPSLGPVFGIKGGATGGGYSQVIPMDDINLHFNGDMHAITSANNLLSSIIDNHIHQGNILNIDKENVVWKRCLDINDRNLRCITTGQGRDVDGVTMKSGFTITAASEIMAILCLSKNIEELKERLSNILVAYTYDKKPVYCSDLKAQNAMAILLKEAIKPNLVQTLEGSPVLIHGGPFANIAHGCNSTVATLTAMTLGEYCVTEAGFGADLGAEKFLDVKCRLANLNPDCVVLVATIKALKYNGGVAKDNLKVENLDALKEGFKNLQKHIENIVDNFKLPCVVAINKFAEDTDAEVELLQKLCVANKSKAVVSTAYADGGNGAINLAKAVIDECEKDTNLNFTYDINDTIENKINAIATKIYGAKGVEFSEKAKESIEMINKIGHSNLPIIVAKTQYSLSDDMTLLNRPEDFIINVRDIELKTGSGFIVVLTGNVMLMPGLPKVPASDNMNIDNDGKISGLS